MKPEPIQSALVHRVLAHIAPLVEPLPPNLISKPLLQRHHFLQVTHDNPAEYLVWPNSASLSEQSHVLHLLETQPLPSQEEQLSEPSFQYSADKEDLLAHVRITTDLRLVFHWDKEHGWRYHDLATMPFPSKAYPNFADAIAVYAPDDFLHEQSYEVKVSGDDDADDSYWDAYGQDDDDDSDRPSNARVVDDSNSEDAYWARYSSIQGTADSTIPSPLPVTKPDAAAAASTDAGRIIMPSDDFSIHHNEPYNPLEPPAPAALARALEALSSASGSSSPPLLEESSETDSETVSTNLAEVNPELIPELSPPIFSQRPADEFVVVDSVAGPEDPSQAILQENIKNLYRLWRLGRQEYSAEHDKDLFISTVRQALEGL